MEPVKVLAWPPAHSPVRPCPRPRRSFVLPPELSYRGLNALKRSYLRQRTNSHQVEKRMIGYNTYIKVLYWETEPIKEEMVAVPESKATNDLRRERRGTQRSNTKDNMIRPSLQPDIGRSCNGYSAMERKRWLNMQERRLARTGIVKSKGTRGESTLFLDATKSRRGFAEVLEPIPREMYGPKYQQHYDSIYPDTRSVSSPLTESRATRSELSEAFQASSSTTSTASSTRKRRDDGHENNIRKSNRGSLKRIFKRLKVVPESVHGHNQILSLLPPQPTDTPGSKARLPRHLRPAPAKSASSAAEPRNQQQIIKTTYISVHSGPDNNGHTAQPNSTDSHLPTQIPRPIRNARKDISGLEMLARTIGNPSPGQTRSRITPSSGSGTAATGREATESTLLRPRPGIERPSIVPSSQCLPLDLRYNAEVQQIQQRGLADANAANTAAEPLGARRSSFEKQWQECKQRLDRAAESAAAEAWAQIRADKESQKQRQRDRDRDRERRAEVSPSSVTTARRQAASGPQNHASELPSPQRPPPRRLRPSSRSGPLTSRGKTSTLTPTRSSSRPLVHPPAGRTCSHGQDASVSTPEQASLHEAATQRH